MGSWIPASNSLLRRDFLHGVVVLAGGTLVSPVLKHSTEAAMENKYGLYGKLQAQSGKGKELGELLLKAAKSVGNAKGCVLYVVSRNREEPDAIYVFEVWDSKDDHDNSLKLPGAQELISQAKPLIAGKPEGTVFEVIGGKGVD